MTLLATIANSCLFVLAPQGATSEVPSSQERAALLTAKEQTSLRTKLQKMLEADEEYDAATGRARDRASKNRQKAKESFRSEWESKGKKGNLLASIPDLKAIYENCFAVGKAPGSPGTVRPGKTVDFGEDRKYDYNYFLPKTYKPAVPMTTVLMLPGLKEGETTWVDGRRYFDATWQKTAAVDDTIFHIPKFADGLEFDPTPDFSRDGQEALEQRRIETVWGTYGRTMMEVNVDRPRVFVDCGRGSSSFGVRFVSMFPDRFAGVILRHPTAFEDLRLGSLAGIPVLMIKTAATAAAIETLSKQFEAMTPESVTVIDAVDEYPFKGSADAIREWMAKQRRNMTPKRVIIEPNHNRFNNAYWVRIESMNPIHTSSAENKPRIEVTADRENNRIVIKAQGIEDFSLLLNDEIVDLDKEFTVVVNDKAVTEKRRRDERGMVQRMKTRRDWECLFPVFYSSSVPKDDAKGNDAKGNDAKGNDAKGNDAKGNEPK